MTEYEIQKEKYLDDKIRQLYSSPKGTGQIGEFCKRHQITYSFMRRRALKLNAYKPNQIQTPWNKQEVQILIKNKNLCFGVIQKKLKHAGFTRSESAIAMKSQHMGLSHKAGQLACQSDKWYSLNTFAGLMGISNAVVRNWIKRGLLKATSPKKDKRGPPHYRIHPRQIREFLINSVGVIEIAKIDKFWLMDILANKNAD